MSSEVYRDGPTERMAINEALGGIRLELHKTLPCDTRVFIDRIFGWQAALALAEPAIVDRQYRKPEVAQLLDTKELAGQVPARAVKIQNGRRVRRGRRPPPGVDVLRLASIRNGKSHLLDVGRHSGVPACISGDDAEGKLPLLLGKRSAAGSGQGGRYAQNREKTQPSGAQPSHEAQEHDGRLPEER